MIKKVLITGCAGYIGRIVCNIFLENGYKVIGIDNLSKSKKNKIYNHKNFIFYKLDYGNNKIADLIKNNNIKNIIHLAAYINVAESEKNKSKYLHNNVIKLINFFKIIEKLKIENLIFASTCAIFNTDQTNLEPKSTYAVTKLLGERIIEFYSRKYNFFYCFIRYFNVVGADNKNNLGKTSFSDHLFTNIINSIKAKRTINIYGKNLKTKDGTCERDYIHVLDLAQFHLDILEHMYSKKDSFKINYGYKKKTTTKEIINNFNFLIKNKIKYSYKKKRDGDVESIYLKKIDKTVKQIHKFKYKSLKKIIVSELKFNKIELK
jgi:UDP-glucose 4-epimerase